MFNFGQASSRDELVYGSARPGFSKDNEKPGAVADSDVDAWVEFMQSQGIKRILSLLGDDEAEWYASHYDALMERHGFKVMRTSVFKENAADVMEEALKAAALAEEKIVIHCSGGAGRATLGLGFWLCIRYDLSPEDAIAEVLQSAEKQDGVTRRLDPNKLITLLQHRSLVSGHH
mmetsp:Transcript_17508/g.22829  ORF Transcript_17508/g.22829 Transcript_17508/m.22829 type:complete len:175 (+) Transcript_17508:71-595(+)|eukprot:CAMPEP_0197296904 /NCGR_PEP_ID=MMETSP0890-20130614/39685_1 /TAXON_ID=44058 ORGANISM="Aureoumbra lagunensis, Strain CCMP1510" /NCGR_SAMPLE_ID=MMETSP0890 /ASSEMBLY_ACC=CAM_ASM_000533 /LENGTH=174 /DNA_ID=CAMNT_0042773735 /DNA_START=60 /DNA_END=587 /DNA_ORIENTATION=-